MDQLGQLPQIAVHAVEQLGEFVAPPLVGDVLQVGRVLTPQARGEFAKFVGAEAGKASVARGLALDLAGEARLMGETALLALWISAEAGAAMTPRGGSTRPRRAGRCPRC